MILKGIVFITAGLFFSIVFIVIGALLKYRERKDKEIRELKNKLAEYENTEELYYRGDGDYND